MGQYTFSLPTRLSSNVTLKRPSQITLPKTVPLAHSLSTSFSHNTYFYLALQHRLICLLIIFPLKSKLLVDKALVNYDNVMEMFISEPTLFDSSQLFLFLIIFYFLLYLPLPLSLYYLILPPREVYILLVLIIFDIWNFKFFQIFLKKKDVKFFFFSTGAFSTRTYNLSHFTSPFLWRVFQDRISWTICGGWLWTSILLSSWDYRHEPLSPGKFFTSLVFYTPHFSENFRLFKYFSFPCLWLLKSIFSLFLPNTSIVCPLLA
jgi:hypothetical protein